MFFPLVELEWPQFRHILFGSEHRVTTIRHHDDTDYDKDDPDNSSRFHEILKRPPPGDQVNDQDDDRDDKQQMNERATKMTDEAKQPKNQ
jgi:hypothetical protein